MLVSVTLRKHNGGFGFSIAGGIDAPVEDDDFGIYITSIIEGGAAYLDGNLQIGDKVQWLRACVRACACVRMCVCVCVCVNVNV